MAARLAAFIGLVLFLVGFTAQHVGAVFPGGNGKIAFTSHRDGNWEIYVMNPDGSGQANLTNDPGDDGGPGGAPAWSPDGSRIAFGSNRDGDYDLFVMNADGSNVVQLTDSAGADGSPAWSPDGSRIAFISFRDGNAEVYVMAASGANQLRLTNNIGWDLFPAWSPDAGRIAFHSTRQDPNPAGCIPDCILDIYTMAPNGAGITQITTDGRSAVPDWSPDANLIAFEKHDPGEFHVYVMNPDGSNQTSVTNPPAAAADPAWSPDGTRIAFDGSGSEIYTMNADGTNRVQLTNTNDISSFPDWQPVGGTPLSTATPAPTPTPPPSLGGVAAYPAASSGRATLWLALASGLAASGASLGAAARYGRRRD